MIQVVKRVFDLLELLSKRGPLPLRELAAAAQINRTTACNILSSLCNLGMLERKEGLYHLGSELRRLLQPQAVEQTLSRHAQSCCDKAATSLHELVLLCRLEHQRLLVLAEAAYHHSVTVNPQFYREGDVYQWAAGRLLLAHSSEAQQHEIVATLGLPGRVWREVGGSRSKLQRELARLRGEDAACKLSPDGQVHSVAVPVRAAGSVVAAIATCMPVERYRRCGAAQVRTELAIAASELEARLK